jgi:hypothetical protein
MYWDYLLSFFLQAIIAVLFFSFYRWCNKALKIIGVAIVVNLIVELVAYIFALGGRNNLFIFHGLTIFQFCMLSLFYKHIIQYARVRIAVDIAIPLFILFAIINAVYFNPLNRYNSYALVIKHFFLSLLILTYFYQLLISNEVEIIQLNPYFWISSGLLIASLGNFFIEGLMNYLLSISNALATNFYLAGVVLTCLFYLCTIVSFLLVRYSKNTVTYT